MQHEILNNKKIAVVGVGGVGGYIAGMLGRVCRHLTLVARGERKKSIEENGLMLHSEYNGEIHIRPESVVTSDELEKQDYIFLCVKNYSLEEVCEEIKDAVSDDTVIIPVMNGVDPGEKTRRFIGKGTVIDSLIYIVAFSDTDYSITQQGNYARLCIGVNDSSAKEDQKIKEVSSILSGAGIDHKVVQDIALEVWRKYILNCAFNVLTAYYDNTIGQLRDDPEKAQQYETLVHEAAQVATAKGIKITKEHVDAIIYRFYYETAYEATSSLQRDINAGKKSEVDTFSGYIVREAEKYGISAPVSVKMYEGLKEKV